MIQLKSAGTAGGHIPQEVAYKYPKAGRDSNKVALTEERQPVAAYEDRRSPPLCHPLVWEIPFGKPEIGFHGQRQLEKNMRTNMKKRTANKIYYVWLHSYTFGHLHSDTIHSRRTAAVMRCDKKDSIFNHVE